MPSYVKVNKDADEKSITIENLCINCLRNKNSCKQVKIRLISGIPEKYNTKGEISLYKKETVIVFYIRIIECLRLKEPCKTYVFFST